MRIEKIAPTALFYLLIVGIFIAATYLGSETTSAVAQLIPLEREHTIVIDAGHGGEDGGAISCTGVPESRINLEIALKLNDLLHLLGYDTLMIRSTDRSVCTGGDTIAARKVSDLRERVRIVNETENPVLVSIHQNIFSDSRYGGAQVFYGKTEYSRELADALQDCFARTVNPGSSRRCKKAESIYLMDHINCTGILVECGFLSNPSEEAKLRKGEYQQKLCMVIGTALANFLDR